MGFEPTHPEGPSALATEVSLRDTLKRVIIDLTNYQKISCNLSVVIRTNSKHVTYLVFTAVFTRNKPMDIKGFRILAPFNHAICEEKPF